ncbi:hypothetical protein [Desulfovibrio sp. ZJ369]|uniref:hypothetical protein n=1 Tax=Desulfovibrio sp. ZJ369 TaxID=2709793 RepID=UPI001F14A2CA|nr:hypothetical protein [Desulfovibrio sp. ZJ369]
MSADYMIKAWIIGVKAEQAEQQKQSPEEKKKAEQLPAEFMGVRKTNLPDRAKGLLPAPFESG